MFTSSRPFHPWLLTLLCSMLLVVRMGGAHLHLCFDGAEPPASMHLLDHGIHHDIPVLEVQHLDVDIAVASEVLAKFAKPWLELSVILLAALLVWSLLHALRRPVPGYRNPLGPSTARFLLPPLRGPPSHSLA